MKGSFEMKFKRIIINEARFSHKEEVIIMKKMRLFAAIGAAAVMFAQTVIPASASSFSREELIEKYGYLLQRDEYVPNPCYLEAHGDASYMPKTGEVIRSGKADGFQYEILDTGKARINGLDDAQIDIGAETLIIPETIDGCPVTEIGYRAFEKCYEKMPAIKDIKIPDSVEIVAEGAFADAFNWESCVVGPITVGLGIPYADDRKINIPEHVVFIGFEAFDFDLFAISNAQNGDRIIHLPETLEYISYTAFGDPGRRYLGGFDIDMPESLVFMSDYFFSSFNRYYSHGYIWKRQVIWTVDESIAPEDRPLALAVNSDGFYMGERNIVTMGEMIGAEVVYAPGDKGWYKKAVSDAPSGYNSACAMAAKYAPDLLPENVKVAAKAKNYSDVKFDQTPGIAATGDIDQNGEINIADAILLARFIAEDNDISITEEGITAADLDADGYVTAMDQNKLLELIAHADF